MSEEINVIAEILNYLKSSVDERTDFAKINRELGLNLSKDHTRYYINKLQIQDLVFTHTNSRGTYLSITPGGLTWLQSQESPTLINTKTSMIDIFLSHSNRDSEIAEKLVHLLEKALVIPNEKIICTSVPGYKLKGGENIDSRLQHHLANTKVVIGLLSENSLKSSYVLFELGGGWVSGSRLIPVCINLNPSELKPPLSNMHLFKMIEEDIWQLIKELGKVLDRTPLSPDAYHSHMKLLLQRIKEYRGNDHESGVVENPRSTTLTTNYTEEEIRILKEASKPGQGRITLPESKDGWCVQVDSNQLCQTLDGRERSKWQSAINQLKRRGLIESIYYDDTIFIFTAEGYSEADRISKN